LSWEDKMNQRLISKLIFTVASGLFLSSTAARADDAEGKDAWILLGQHQVGPGSGPVEIQLPQGAHRIHSIRIVTKDTPVRLAWLDSLASRGQGSRSELNDRLLPGETSDVIGLSPSCKKARLSVARMPKQLDSATLEIWGSATTGS
jgi:hypothetical protein